MLVVALGGCGEATKPDRTKLLGERVYLQAIEDAKKDLLASLERRVRRLEAEESRASVRASSDGGAADLDALGTELGAQVGGTIGMPGSDPLIAGSLQSGSAWSTIKVPLALTVIDDAGGPSGLGSAQSSNITAALTASDNEAAAALFDDLVSRYGDIAAASGAITQTLREAGDSSTVVSTEGRDGFSSYGQTEWSQAAQNQFVSSLLNGCVGREDARELVLSQMRSVTSDTWGIGSVGLPALWKGGWGPGTDGRYLARQMGAVEVDGTQYVVTLAVIPDDGSFGSAQSDATAVAEWLVNHAPAGGSSGGC